MGAMPEAAQQKDDQQIHGRTARSEAVSAERNVEVVAEPVRQRDVPAPPELLHRLRNVGIVEIVDDAKTEEPAQSSRHVRVAGEVEVDLAGVAKDAEPRGGRGQVARVGGKGLIGVHGEHVGEQELLREADDENARCPRSGPPSSRDLAVSCSAMSR